MLALLYTCCFDGAFIKILVSSANNINSLDLKCFVLSTIFFLNISQALFGRVRFMNRHNTIHRCCVFPVFLELIFFSKFSTFSLFHLLFELRSNSSIARAALVVAVRELISIAVAMVAMQFLFSSNAHGALVVAVR